MNARRIFVLVMTIVIVGRTCHCLATTAFLCGWTAASATGAPPLRDPAEADPNETGCICRGAIFVPAITPEHLRPAKSCWEHADELAMTCHVVAEEPGIAARWREIADSRPPTSGRALRAWLGSLQI